MSAPSAIPVSTADGSVFPRPDPQASATGSRPATGRQTPPPASSAVVKTADPKSPIGESATSLHRRAKFDAIIEEFDTYKIANDPNIGA